MIDTQVEVLNFFSFSTFTPAILSSRIHNFFLLLTVVGVTSGTLDAIRERMKSIQAAASGGNLDVGIGSMGSVDSNMHASQNQVHGMISHDEAEQPAQASISPMDEKALSGLQARMQRLKSGSLESL